MSRTSALRRQHDAASALASRLQDEIERHRADRDTHGISVMLAKLLGLLSIHLAQEDRSLYPAMMASGDERAAAVARRFAEEMGGLAGRLKTFAAHWSSPAAIASNYDDFRQEAGTVLAALGERIERENECLYPLADALFGQAMRPAA